MPTKLPAVLFLLTTTLLPAQQIRPAPVDAVAPRVDAGPIQQRVFCIQHVGSQLSSRTALLQQLSEHLTPNLGSLEYFPYSQTLVGKDTTAALDALAAAVAKVDVAPAQILLAIKVVRLTDPGAVARALAGSGQSCQEGVAVLDAEQVKTALLRLKQESAGIVVAPQIIALDDQKASIFIGTERAGKLQPDGGVAAPLDPDSIDVDILPRIQAGTDCIGLSLHLRTLFTSLDGAVLSQRMLVRSGQTAVLQKFAAENLGAMVFVTAGIVREVGEAK